MLYLKALNLEDAAAEYACLQDLPSENGFENEAYGISFERFVQEEIPKRLRASQARTFRRDACPIRITSFGIKAQRWHCSRYGII